MKPRVLGNTNFAKHLPGLSETLRTQSQVFFGTADDYNEEANTIDFTFTDPSSGRVKSVKNIALLFQPAGLSSSNFTTIDNFKDLIWIVLSPTGSDMNTPVAIGCIDPIAVSKNQQLSPDSKPALLGIFKF